MPFKDIEARRAYHRQRHRMNSGKMSKEAIEGAIVRKVNFTMRIPVTMVARMQMIAAESMMRGKYPWKTTQEVARALLELGFHGLKNELESVDEYLPELRLEQQLNRMHKARQTAMSMFNMAKQNLNALLDVKADAAALQYFHTALLASEELPPTVWSEWLIRQLRETYPSMAKRHDKGDVGGVSLLSTAERRKKERKTVKIDGE